METKDFVIKDITMALNLKDRYGYSNSAELVKAKETAGIAVLDDSGNVNAFQSFKVSAFVNAKIAGVDGLFRASDELCDCLGSFVRVVGNARFRVCEYDWEHKKKKGHTKALQLVGLVVKEVLNASLEGLEGDEDEAF